MVDPTGVLARRIEFSPYSQGGVPLPGGIERGADYRWAVDLARVGVDPAVVHRRKGKAGRLEPSLGGVLGEHEMAPAGRRRSRVRSFSASRQRSMARSPSKTAVSSKPIS